MEEKKEIKDVDMKVAEQKEEEKIATVIFEKLQILPMVVISQNQNGLRHQDYQRYQRFCSNKVHRLRKTLKLTQGKTKFQKKEITAETSTSTKVLHILLFVAEKNWAEALFFRKQQETGFKKTSLNRLKFRISKKLKKAANAAQLLLDIAEQKLDDESVLEAEAYLGYVRGTYLVEKEQFGPALDNFLKAQYIYDRIGSNKDTLDSILYKEKNAQIEPSIRLCSFKLGGLDSKKKDAKVKFDNQNKIDERIKSISLAGIDTKGGTEITFNNKKIPINSEKIQNILHLIDENLKEVQAKGREQSKNLLPTIFSRIEEAISIVTKEKTSEAAKSEGSVQIFNSLINYLQSIKLKLSLEKYYEPALSFQKRNPFELFFAKKREKADNPEMIVKLYNKLIRSQKQLLNNEKESTQNDPRLQTEYDVLEDTYTIFKNVAVSGIFIVKRKYAQAYSILEFILAKIEGAISTYEKQKLSGVSKRVDQQIEDLNNLIKNVEVAKCKLHAKILEKEDAEIKTLQKGMHDVKIEEAKKDEHKKSSIYETLGSKDSVAVSFDQLQNFSKELDLPNVRIEGVKKDSEKAAQYKEALLAASKGRLPKLVNYIPEIKPVHYKPHIFDIAFDYLEYPELEEKKEEGKGLFKKVFGFFGKS